MDVFPCVGTFCQQAFRTFGECDGEISADGPLLKLCCREGQSWEEAVGVTYLIVINSRRETKVLEGFFFEGLYIKTTFYILLKGLGVAERNTVCLDDGSEYSANFSWSNTKTPAEKLSPHREFYQISTNYSQESRQGAGERSHGVKHQLCKQEDPSLIPSIHGQKRGVAAHSCNMELGGWGREEPYELLASQSS